MGMRLGGRGERGEWDGEEREKGGYERGGAWGKGGIRKEERENGVGSEGEWLF